MLMTEQPLATDGQLLAEYVDSGGQRPFELLVRRHAGLVLGVCRGVLRESHDAEDAAQAAFLTLARKAPSLRGQTTVAGWLHRVAWHVSMRAREARRLRQQRERGAAEALGATRDDADETRDVAALVHEQLVAMPEKYRVPLVLHHIEGWSEQEVAQMLGCKLGTVSGRLSRARQMLKDRLESRGVRGAAATAAFAAIVAVQASAASAAELARATTAPGVHAEALAHGAIRAIDHSRRLMLALACALAVLLIVGVGAWWSTSSGSNGARNAVAPLTDGSISGVVVGPSGRAVANVAVRVWLDREAAQRGAAPVQQTITRGDGSFVVPDVPAGPKRFVLCVIQRPLMHARADVDVVAGQENSAGRLVLQEGRYDN